MAAQVGGRGRRRRSGLQHHIGHQPPAGAALLGGEDHGLAHAGHAAELRLDLAQLDAEAADLHLGVGAAGEGDLAVRQIAAQVARAVEAVPGPRDKGIGEEPLGRPRLVPEVAARQVRAAHGDLAHLADPRQLPAAAQHQELDVLHPPPQGQHLLAVLLA